MFVSITLFASCTSGPLEGDWFQCEDAACTTLDDNGVRFTANGRWGALEAPGGDYEPGEAYELDNPRGTYTLEGNTLTLYLDGSNEPQSMRISFDGDDILVHGVPQVSVACTEPVPTREDTTSSGSTCKEEPGEPRVLRFRRVGDAGEVPKISGSRPDDDDRVSGSATIQPPPAGN
jgi:hypothetical protein